MSIEDTVNFCEQYYDKYKTFESLFVIVEFAGPHYALWQNIIEERNYSVTPIVAQKNLNEYITSFVRHSNKKNYLIEQELFHFVRPEQIPENLLCKHYSAVEDYHKNSPILFAKHLLKSREQITWMHDWLESRNIAYMFNWASGTKQSYMRLVDKAFAGLLPRLIPMQIYTGLSKGEEWSNETFGGHPDYVGQTRIADFLVAYTQTHNLLKAPKNST